MENYEIDYNSNCFSNPRIKQIMPVVKKEYLVYCYADENEVNVWLEEIFAWGLIETLSYGEIDTDVRALIREDFLTHLTIAHEKQCIGIVTKEMAEDQLISKFSFEIEKQKQLRIKEREMVKSEQS